LEGGERLDAEPGEIDAVFLYRQVLGAELDWLGKVVRTGGSPWC